MEEEWSLPDVPALLEDAGRNTAENASRSLPLIRAIGEIRRGHGRDVGLAFRAPYFFAPYRVPRPAPVVPVELPRALAAECCGTSCGSLPATRRERRAAMAAVRLASRGVEL